MEIILFLTMMVMITYVFSGYLYRVALVQSSRVDLIFTRFENMCFKIIGTDLEHMSAKTYVKHFLAFNGFMGYIICIANSSAMAFLNPNHNLNQSIDLAFNTAISFNK